MQGGQMCVCVCLTCVHKLLIEFKPLCILITTALPLACNAYQRFGSSHCKLF